MISYVEVQVTSENKHIDVDIYCGGIGQNNVYLVVTAYNTKVFNTNLIVYAIDTNSLVTI